jgi:hypothetical protein
MVVETLFERLVEPKEGLPGGGLEQSVFNVTGFYTWMFNAARTPLQRYTVPVKIDAEHDPGTIASNDICGQREQAARMLCRIDRASPKAVVFDKYYGTKNCSVNAVVYLTLKVFDCYVNPLLVGVTAILVRVMGALFHRVEERASA